jgi:hypothetical protein
MKQARNDGEQGKNKELEDDSVSVQLYPTRISHEVVQL